MRKFDCRCGETSGFNHDDNLASPDYRFSSAASMPLFLRRDFITSPDPDPHYCQYLSDSVSLASYFLRRNIITASGQILI